MHRTHSALALKVSAIALALAFQGAAFAAQPATGDSTAPAAAAGAASSAHHSRLGHHKAWGHHHHAAMWVPGYGAVSQKQVDALKLDDAQAKLLKSAQDAQQALLKQRHDRMKDAQQARTQALDAGKIDPHQVVTDRQQAWQADSDARANVQKQWLAVWDALKPEQQQALAKDFKERATKRAAWHEKHAGHHGKDHKAPESQSSTPGSSS